MLMDMLTVRQDSSHVLTTQSMSFEERDEAESHLLGLYSKIGEGCYALSRYDCDYALTMFKSLPASQANTPYVVSQIAKASYESRNLTEVFPIVD
jgi:anaphase-promoting complex subunit 3